MVLELATCSQGISPAAGKDGYQKIRNMQSLIITLLDIWNICYQLPVKFHFWGQRLQKFLFTSVNNQFHRRVWAWETL